MSRHSDWEEQRDALWLRVREALSNMHVLGVHRMTDEERALAKLQTHEHVPGHMRAVLNVDKAIALGLLPPRPEVE